MKFSIVIPSYNQGIYIERTLESIFAQKNIDIEVLVFDGGSKDNTLEILKRYGTRIQWISRKDRGQTDAINQGLHIATGDILAYLNSDDVYYPNALERVLAYFQSHPQALILYGNGDHIDENDRVLEPYYNEPWNYDRLCDICYLCQPAVFWKRDVLEKFGYFDDSLHYAMDYDYWLRVGKHTPIHYLDGLPLAKSRMYPNNKTLSKRYEVHKEILQVANKYSNTPPYRWLKTLAHIQTEENKQLQQKGNSAETACTYVEAVLSLADKYNIILNTEECNKLELELKKTGL